MKPALPSTAYIAAAAAVEVPRSAEARQRLQLLPIGRVDLRDGRGPYFLSAENAADVIEATRRQAGRTDILVDYDHQHHFGVKEGVAAQAPAAGWIKPDSLTADAQGIWGEVEWTPAAAERLQAREYRYVSPLFAFDPKTRAVRALLAASLTNVPAIESLAAAASAKTQPEKDPMDYSQIATALGLAEGATLDDILAKIAAMAPATTAASAVAAAARKLGLAETATVDELVAAAAKPDPAKFVPVDALTDLQSKVARFTADRVEQLVAAAMEAGKVAPALKDWAVSYATKDEAGFQDWLAKAPAILGPGATITAAAGQLGGDGLTESERAVAKMLGRTPEQFLAAKKGA
jgi:phage I-like protein